MIGARLGGIGLGTMGGIGLVILVFVFGLPPGSPPGIVTWDDNRSNYRIGVNAISGWAGLSDIPRYESDEKKPRNITFVAPFITYFLILASGTQHVIYALLPVIAEVATKAGVRPERANVYECYCFDVWSYIFTNQRCYCCLISCAHFL
ncbi:MAG: anaerobic C4-dicarboxylate transporter family protein [Ignavibacteriales bacterium]|nr:anaerobic C4-dicarboxylate transporter family protein [Ignavibacteriales bacterium]